jgi:uncharacterized RDD family membrane protein YckC
VLNCRTYAQRTARRGCATGSWRLRTQRIWSERSHCAVVVCASSLRAREGNVRSAKRTVIQICSQCGALLYDDSPECSFCDAPLGVSRQTAEAVGVAVDVSEPEWRKEVARRLEAYRERRHRYEDDSQSALPFIQEIEEDEEIPLAASPEAARSRQPERVEISLIQPELDFVPARDYRSHPQTALVPVASNEARRWAGILDGIFLFLTYAGFLALFRSLGGQMLLDKVGTAVYASTFFLLYIQYFALFTTFAGATPGMQLRGLYVVRLDGYLPDTSQLLWRSFGYCLSGGTLLLGFLWSLWDEDHFTWQDRISQTYVTSATPLTDCESVAVARGGKL